MEFLDRPEWRLAVALAIGLVIGTERERRKHEEHTPDRAGVRTFSLAALLGGVLVRLGGAAGGIAAVVVVAGYGALAHVPRRDERDPTTEVALVLAAALGALAQLEPLLGLGAGLVVSFLLALRGPLRRVANELVTDQELLDALTFAVAAVVVLPMLPDRSIDPWGAINPFVLWRLVVIVMAVTGAGYLAVRWVGPRYGLFVAGLASGFVSSTATIGAMGSRARADASLAAATAAGAAASTVATFAQLGIVLAAARPTLLATLAAPLLSGGAVALVVALTLALRLPRVASGRPASGRAFSAKVALVFTAVVAAVGVIAVMLRQHLGQAGDVVAAAVGGLVDAHASASAVAAGSSSDELAGLAVLVAITTNTGSKVAFALASGPPPFRRRVVLGLVLTLAAAWAGWLVARW
ncbi:MAG: MgtC/SapB family protein [Kofleriaceae bacterium]|jgi:uncharacterized membrane protein (DUF4010 family)|nr:MgtC/SapB family protein [Kofleriaceae bacterium]MBP6836854.1 MgtC/SapB family protein [Kofleriaceae bacterium]MBP9205027.1 MgtC/SapB family protein [Kofleriaceae bacterium]